MLLYIIFTLKINYCHKFPSKHMLQVTLKLIYTNTNTGKAERWIQATLCAVNGHTSFSNSIKTRIKNILAQLQVNLIFHFFYAFQIS